MLIEAQKWLDLQRLSRKIFDLGAASVAAVEAVRGGTEDFAPVVNQLLSLVDVDPDSSEGHTMQSLAKPVGIQRSTPNE